MPSRRLLPLLCPLAALALAGALAGAGCAAPGGSLPPTAAAPGWAEVEALLDEQRLAAALERLAAIEAAARSRRDDRELARALVRRAQIQIALGGYAAAIEGLRSRPWPEEPRHRAAVELYDAQALLSYLDAYGWEIRQRERVVAGEQLDLERWTADQITAEADRAFARVWARRLELGEVPVADFELLAPNDYPAGIRPSVRDAVSYLWSERLGDSAHWSPAELEETWKLDLAALAEGSAPAPTGESHAGAVQHPLATMTAVLGDLERWHRERGEFGAALEARLERLVRLHDALAAESDRDRLRDALAASLPAFRRDPWWAMGMARLAALWRASSAPDALVRAREVAVAGERAFPGEPGSSACRRQREEIEAPSYGLQAMAIDAAARRSVEISHRNLGRLHLRAYRLEPRPFAARPVVWEGWSEERVRPLLGGRPAASWSVELPATADYRDHRSFTTPPLVERGRYLVVASADPSFGRRDNQLQAVELQIGDLVLLHGWTRRSGRSWLAVHALSGTSGEPIAAAEAELYRWQWERPPELVARRATDADGGVEFETPADERRGGGFSVVVRHRGEEAVWQQGHWPTGRELEDPAALGTLVFTDRAVYRPGQKLLWKTLTYSGRRARGELRAAAGRRIEVRLLDANGERIAEAAATTNAFGTAAGEFDLPAGRLLGEWRVETDFGGSATVAVEEYKRPTFEVTLAPPREEPRLNRPVELEGEARYHFGLPVAGGRVAWRVVREPLWEWGWRVLWPPPAPPRTIANGRAAADADGKFTIRFTPEADERERVGCGCFRFRVEAELTDEGGETRSGELALGLGWVGVRLRLPGEPFLVTPATRPSWSLRREDLDGEPRAGETSWRILELEQPERALLPSELPERLDPAREPYATPGDRLRPRWAGAPETQEILGGWSARREVARGALRHGEDGGAALGLPALGPGAYRLVAETRDRHGEPARLEHGFVVAAAAEQLALPLELAFAEPTVSVGGTARLFVHSGLPGQTILLELLRGDELLERRRLVAGRDPVWIEIPVGAEDRGGFGARAALVSDHQIVQRAAALAVPWDDKGLTIELSSFRDRLTPGASESFRVTVRGPRGEPLAPGAAELVAAMYDRSLDLFRAHAVPLASQLYPAFGAPELLASGLGGRGPVWSDSEGWGEPAAAPSFRADELVALDPYGVGGPGERGGPIAFLERGMAVQAAPAAQQQELVAHSSDARRTKAEEAPGASPLPAAELRSDFSETAFWRPHLVTDAAGGVAVEFRVPDALTVWKVWVSAWTRDLAAGYVEREVRTAKELMVRPYLPRFLREGDAARLVVVVNNAAARELAGEVRFAIVDPETDSDRSADFGLPAGGGRAVFTAAAGRSAELAFPVTAPRGARPLAVRVEAAAGGLADGELRPLPLLPSRLHLAQSRFAALRDGERRELVFEDLKRSDPTRVDERLVITLDGQLFYAMLDALPYLVDYPYECTEQTMNRYLSTAILGSLFERHPAVARMAEQLAQRDSRWERFDAADPNRRLALEEAPWLREARGGGEDEALLRVLDPAVARAVRADSLARLERAQLPSGAFPWFPGGPPSPHMTLYLMAGFARAAEFGDQVPRPLVERGWSYLAREIDRDWWRHALAENCCWELLTFANYVASSYPDPAVMGDVLPAARRREILDFSFAHWKEHAPQSKLQLALTLGRMGRAGDARRVLEAVMDSAKSDRDLGTFWAPEERAWLWYNDTLETHAWALRALSEITPGDARREGLVQWLFLNKKLGHWKSTRATAEVLYSLAHYLAAENLLGAREEIAVTVGGATRSFVFEPDAFTGKRNRVVLEGAEIVPVRDATTVIEPKTRGTAFASATWQFSTEELPAAASGDLFRVERRWFRRLKQGEETTLEPLADGASLAVGDELEVQLSIRARAAAEYVHLRDPRAAGLEPDTSRSGWRWDLGLAHYEETRDSGTNFFFESLPAGEYTLKYRLRAAVAGSFRAAPAELQSMYAPEFVAYSAGSQLVIAPLAR